MFTAVVIAVAAIGLSFASDETANVIRSSVRDLLRPAQVWTVDCVAATKIRLRSFVDADDPSISELSTQRGRAEDLRRLQLKNAMLHEHLAQARRFGSSPYRTDSTHSAFTADLVEARVLGVETSTQFRGGYLLGQGANAGLAESDLVLEDGNALIDAGETRRLEPGLPVFAGRCVVGRIKRVGRWTSTVEHVTDKEFRGHAQIVRKTSQGYQFGTTGVITGTGKDHCRLTMVPASQPVAVGDAVYTLSDGGVFPYPMYYGRIVRAEIPTGASHWELDVAPAARSARPRTVQILRKRLNPRIAAAAAN